MNGPLLVIAGEADQSVPIGGVRAVVKQICAAKQPVTFRSYPGLDHDPRALEVTVGAEFGSRVKPTNPEVYDLYLKGLHARDTATHEATEESVATFQQALKLAPDYAPASAELARSLMFMCRQGWLPPRDSCEQSRQYAERAVRLDPDLSRRRNCGELEAVR